jgi:hypothetical protein
MLFWPPRVKDYLKAHQPNTIEFQAFKMPYKRAMHAKMVAVDGRVVVMNASPILQCAYRGHEIVWYCLSSQPRGVLSDTVSPFVSGPRPTTWRAPLPG